MCSKNIVPDYIFRPKYKVIFFFVILNIYIIFIFIII